MRKPAIFLLMIGVIAVYEYADIVHGFRHLFAILTEPDDVVVVKGRIVQSEPILLAPTHRGRHPYRVDYNFVNSEGKSVLGSDIVFGIPRENGHRIDVTYSPSNPARNRLAQGGELALALTGVIFPILMVGLAAVITLVPRTR
ncbi:MAG TPA: DUF3592 domain-containing protein [Thermoanaerobaculia bacterium]|nr:DUF3592 domain-containing protein [Thermoanaerobaculia bacterium]